MLTDPPLAQNIEVVGQKIKLVKELKPTKNSYNIQP